jgi:hypothetical protein
MATTFLKRQKEMKRLEKQREKAERRAQRKLAGRMGNDDSPDNMNPADVDVPDANATSPPESEPQN